MELLPLRMGFAARVGRWQGGAIGMKKTLPSSYRPIFF